MPKGMRPIREELGIHAPMVCYSGGLVLDPDDQEIYSCLLDLDLACEIKSLVAKEFPEVVCGIYGGEHWVVDDIRDPWVIQEQGITHLIPETGDIREIFGKEGGIHKFLFMGDPYRKPLKRTVSTAFHCKIQAGLSGSNERKRV